MKRDEILKFLPESLEYRLAPHNGHTLSEYPESEGWTLVPFPLQKGDVFCADNLATVNRHSFVQDPDFIGTREVAEERWAAGGLVVRDVSWRLRVVQWSHRLALQFWLDSMSETTVFMECGTGRGYMAAAMLEERRHHSRLPELYLMDSFSPYVPGVTGEQSEGGIPGYGYASSAESLVSFVERAPGVTVVEGRLPDTLSTLDGLTVGFMHLDLNSAVAEESVLQWVAGRLAAPSVLLFDDYGGPGGSDQATVHERFAAFMGTDLLPLPTGQALMVFR